MIRPWSHLLSASLIWLCLSSNAAVAAGTPYVSGLARLTTADDTASRGDASGKLSITVWYPVAAGTAIEPLTFDGSSKSPYFDAGSFAAGTPMLPGTYPLIVISHGTGGTAMQMAWLARVLASHGYIVAAPNHPGNNGLAPYTAQGFVLWWLRAHDLSRTIDAMLADPRYGPHIDRRRIAAAGFSLGGYTMIEIAGGRTSVKRFGAACARRDGDPTCSGPPEFPNLGQRVAALLKTDAAFRAAYAGDGVSYRDPRVKAVFAIAPALAQAMIPSSLRQITIPVSIVVGTADPIAVGSLNGAVLAKAIPGATFAWIPNAGHYTFLDTCTAAGKAALKLFCGDRPGLDRAAVHAEVANRALAFFDGVLGGSR